MQCAKCGIFFPVLLYEWLMVEIQKMRVKNLDANFEMIYWTVL